MPFLQGGAGGHEEDGPIICSIPYTELLSLHNPAQSSCLHDDETEQEEMASICTRGILDWS